VSESRARASESWTRKPRPSHSRLQDATERSSTSRCEPTPTLRSLLFLQHHAGNSAVRHALGQASATAVERRIEVQRGDPEDKATGDDHTPTAERIDRIDGFLADRLSFFQVRIWGERYVALLDRTKNTWSERYTPRALTAAALAAIMRHVADSPPPVAEIEAVREELLREKRYHIEASTTLEPAAVEPIFLARIDREAVGTVAARLGLRLSERGRELEADAAFGAFLGQRLVEVAQNFGSVRRHLTDNAALKAAELAPEHVFVLLTSPGPRESAIQLAKAHRTTRALGDSRDGDWTALSAAQWASALADIAVEVVKAAGRSALERRERQERHELNERLRPHRLDISSADSARYILDAYDPDSSVTVDFLGPVVLKGGQVITNAQGQELFILSAGSRVVYQNLGDRRFYVQSAAGVQQELVYGVFALVAEKTKYIIPAMQFALDVTAAIFPPVRLPYLAVTVLNAGSKVASNLDELLRLAKNVQISCGAIDELLPGLLEKAVRATALQAFGELFQPEYTSASTKQFVLLALRIASAAVRGGAAGPQAGEVVKSAWVEIKKELKSFGGVVAQAQAFVARELSDPESWEEHPVERLTRELKRFAADEGERYARLLMNMDDDELARLARETEELVTHGTALVNEVADCFAW
jgi:hypothetical protein